MSVIGTVVLLIGLVSLAAAVLVFVDTAHLVRDGVGTRTQRLGRPDERPEAVPPSDNDVGGRGI